MDGQRGGDTMRERYKTRYLAQCMDMRSFS
jgi:hypothetical protein